MTGAPAAKRGDDGLLAATRVLALIIIPVLLAAFTVLFGFPSRTRQLWAWTIQPEMAALIMGGAYLAGAWFFARSVLDGRWHRVSVGWLAVIPFTALLGVATGIHWDRFNHDHVSFWAWLVLYTATPVALPLLWVRNQRAGGAPTTPSDLQLPGSIRWPVAGAGAALLAAAAAIYVRPQAVLENWPWELTPLTARTLASFAAFLAVVWLAFAFTGQWSRLALPFEATTVGLVIVVAAVVRGRHDLVGGDRSRIFSLVLATAVVASLALLGWVRVHRRETSGRGRRPPNLRRPGPAGRVLRH